MDDAAGKNPAARLVEADCLSLMRELVQPGGIPAHLYPDRHGVYRVMEKAGGKVDQGRLRQSGRTWRSWEGRSAKADNQL